MNGGIAHAAAKAGVVAMTRQMAAEGAPHGIRANSVSPGTIATHATEHVFADEATRNAVLAPLLIKRSVNLQMSLPWPCSSPRTSHPTQPARVF